jgi:hypothetical protein
LVRHATKRKGAGANFVECLLVPPTLKLIKCMTIDTVVADFITLNGSGDFGDNEVIALLIEKGYSKEVSTCITLFTPIVMGRIICKTLNTNFVDIYYEHFDDITERRGILTENVYYTETYKIVEKLIEDGVLNDEIILKVSSRGPEFKILNDFMLKGSDTKDIKFSPLHIVW